MSNGALVPHLPGVPPLLAYDPDPASLVTGDVLIGIGAIAATLFPQWGVQRADTYAWVIIPSSPLIQTALAPLTSLLNLAAPFIDAASVAGLDVPLLPAYASTASFEYAKDWRVADYQVEQGSFETYDKVELPFDVRVRFVNGGDLGSRQSFLNTIDQMARSVDLFNVVTPEKTYLNVSATHYDYQKTSRSGVTLLIVEVWFQEIRQASTIFSPLTLVPDVATQQGVGPVAPTNPTVPEQSAFNASTLY